MSVFILWCWKVRSIHNIGNEKHHMHVLVAILNEKWITSFLGNTWDPRSASFTNWLPRMTNWSMDHTIILAYIWSRVWCQWLLPHFLQNSKILFILEPKTVERSCILKRLLSFLEEQVRRWFGMCFMTPGLTSSMIRLLFGMNAISFRLWQIKTRPGFSSILRKQHHVLFCAHHFL